MKNLSTFPKILIFTFVLSSTATTLLSSESEYSEDKHSTKSRSESSAALNYSVYLTCINFLDKDIKFDVKLVEDDTFQDFKNALIFKILNQRNPYLSNKLRIFFKFKDGDGDFIQEITTIQYLEALYDNFICEKDKDRLKIYYLDENNI